MGIPQYFASLKDRFVDIVRTMTSREHREHKKLLGFYTKHQLKDLTDVIRLQEQWGCPYHELKDYSQMMHDLTLAVVEDNGTYAIQLCESLEQELKERPYQHRGEQVTTLSELVRIVQGNEPKCTYNKPKHKTSYKFML